MVKLKELVVLAPAQVLVSQQSIAIRARFTDGQHDYTTRKRQISLTSTGNLPRHWLSIVRDSLRCVGSMLK
jgi:hypothetical protein